MRVVCNRTPLPREFSAHSKAHGILAETDIRLTRGSRLAAKVLLFKSRHGLWSFWRHALGIHMEKGAQGAVNPLRREVEDYSVSPPLVYTQVDPRYYCVMGLVQPDLCAEVLVHESVHAGYAYAYRHNPNYWVDQEGMLSNEEDVAYPAGKIARRLNDFLHRGGWY